MDTFVPSSGCKFAQESTPINNFAADTQKLFTILYGLMGMPMFIYSICCIGDSLSLSTMNFQLRFVHYAIKLPFYLLRQLIRLMCCLCCCCYCCGLLAITTQSIFLIPCLKPRRPKLNLYNPLEVTPRKTNTTSKPKKQRKTSDKEGNVSQPTFKTNQLSNNFNNTNNRSQERF